MGATRPAEKCNAQALNKGSQTVLIILMSVSLCFNFHGRVAPISTCVFLQRVSGNLKLNTAESEECRQIVQNLIVHVTAERQCYINALANLSVNPLTCQSVC